MKRRLLLALLLVAVLAAQAQRTYIVCVGINENRDRVDPLPCSRSDARGVAGLYQNYNGSNVVILLDSKATRQNILQALKRQFARSTRNDEIIFAYSGHGFDGGLSTYNNNEVLFCSEVQQLMLQAKARRKLMYIMACHSGSFTKKYRNLRVSALIAVMVSLLAPSVQTVNIASNVVSLVMSFMCGVFVPQSVLSSGVLSVGRFMPVYWYIRANEMLSGGELYNGRQVAECIGIQAGFAVALAALTVLVFKLKRES